jgi:hypothetical protein
VRGRRSLNKRDLNVVALGLIEERSDGASIAIGEGVMVSGPLFESTTAISTPLAIRMVFELLGDGKDDPFEEFVMNGLGNDPENVLDAEVYGGRVMVVAGHMPSMDDDGIAAMKLVGSQ